MRNFIGHSRGRVVFATQSQAIYEFAAPEGVTTIEVDDATYAAIAPTVGQLKFRVEGEEFAPIPKRPTEFHVWDWTTLAWAQDRATAEKAVLAKRATLLVASDWTQLPDVPLETKNAWAAYRQALRDITDQAGFPFDVVWPESPKGNAA